MVKKKAAIIVDKLHMCIDEEMDIKVIDCKPNEMITLKANMCDDSGKIFASKATFKANKDGVVSLSDLKPVEGSYNEMGTSGLFWSMEDSQSRHGDFLSKEMQIR